MGEHASVFVGIVATIAFCQFFARRRLSMDALMERSGGRMGRVLIWLNGVEPPGAAYRLVMEPCLPV